MLSSLSSPRFCRIYVLAFNRDRETNIQTWEERDSGQARRHGERLMDNQMDRHKHRCRNRQIDTDSGMQAVEVEDEVMDLVRPKVPC